MGRMLSSLNKHKKQITLTNETLIVSFQLDTVNKHLTMNKST